jgi:uncharacterized protein DUF4386
VPVPEVGLYRRATAAALVIAPALLLVDNILHPKEFERGNEVEQLREIAAHADRWQLAHALGFVAIVVFAAAVLGLAFLVRRRQPRLGLVGGALGIVGLMSLVAAITLDGYTWGVLGEVSGRQGVDPDTTATALHEVQQSDWSLVYYVPTLAFIAGFVALGIGAVRQRAVPAWAAALLALGGLLAALETVVISNAYFIIASGVLLGGGAAVAVAIARMSDDDFARGGPAGRRPA